MRAGIRMDQKTKSNPRARGFIRIRKKDWVTSKSPFGLFLALFLAPPKNRQEQTKHVFLA